MLSFLLEDPSHDRCAALGAVSADDHGDWWNFERRSHHDPTHPVAGWVAHLLQEAASTRLPCPRCGVVASVWTNLDHLLRNHLADYAEAATWLEDADADLFSLAVHYLATKARAGREAADRIEDKGQQSTACGHSVGARRTRAYGGHRGSCGRPSS